MGLIGRIQGTLISKQPPQLMVDVQGVGYELEAPMSTFYQLPALGETVVLHTHLVVREDAQLLYAFYVESERRLFKTLIRISGVGPKLALTILSGISAEEFSRCVQENNATALTSLPGIGKKTAERLIIELRDRLDDDFVTTLSAVPGDTSSTSRIENPVRDAVSALVALGYRAQDASRMVRTVDTQDKNTENIIREALQGTAKS